MIDRRKSTRWLLLLTVLVLALAACGPAQDEDEELATLSASSEKIIAPEEETDDHEGEEEAEVDEAEAEESAAEAGIEEPAGASDATISFDLYGGTKASEFETTDSGLQYFISDEGDGQLAEDGQIMMLNIVGWMEDGTEIISSQAFGGPVPMYVGLTNGLLGLDEALTYLSTGASARFVLPEELTTDADGNPSGLPPGSVAFEMEVVEIIDGPPEAPQAVDDGDYIVTDSGLKLHDLQEGEGPEVEKGNRVSVNFTGWLEDGTMFGTSIGDQPLVLDVGGGQVFAGWDEGLEGMKSGGKRQLVIPSDLAFGEAGTGGIPPNAELVMEIEVELMASPPAAPQAVDEDDFTVTDSGLRYYDFEEGVGAEVEPGQQVSVEYTGWLEDGTRFDSSVGREPFTLVVGAGQVIPGWDEGLQGMKVGGIRQLVIPAELGYGEGGSGQIPPNSVLIFEVEMLDAQ